MFVTGYFTLIIGLLMVVSHNIWQWDWRVVITLLAWLTLFKGLSIIIFPQFLDKTTILFLKNTYLQYIASYIDFVLGMLLCYFGFKRDVKEMH